MTAITNSSVSGGYPNKGIMDRDYIGLPPYLTSIDANANRPGLPDIKSHLEQKFPEARLNFYYNGNRDWPESQNENAFIEDRELTSLGVAIGPKHAEGMINEITREKAYDGILGKDTKEITIVTHSAGPDRGDNYSIYAKK